MDSPLARIQLPSRKKVAEAKHSMIPEKIHLPDGRSIKVKDILRAPTGIEIYNLRNPVRVPLNKAPGQKYHHEDWIWMATNTIEAIMNRYQVPRAYAGILRSKCLSKSEKYNNC